MDKLITDYDSITPACRSGRDYELITDYELPKKNIIKMYYFFEVRRLMDKVIS
jgi:hypothetical protein